MSPQPYTLERDAALAFFTLLDDATRALTAGEAPSAEAAVALAVLDENADNDGSFVAEQVHRMSPQSARLDAGDWDNLCDLLIDALWTAGLLTGPGVPWTGSAQEYTYWNLDLGAHPAKVRLTTEYSRPGKMVDEHLTGAAAATALVQAIVDELNATIGELAAYVAAEHEGMQVVIKMGRGVDHYPAPTFTLNNGYVLGDGMLSLPASPSEELVPEGRVGVVVDSRIVATFPRPVDDDTTFVAFVTSTGVPAAIRNLAGAEITAQECHIGTWPDGEEWDVSRSVRIDTAEEI